MYFQLHAILSTLISYVATDAYSASAAFHDSILKSLPSSFANVSVVCLKDNAAVLPETWQSGSLTASFYDIKTDQNALAKELGDVKAAEFIAFHESFLDIIGTAAKVERVLAFPPAERNTHEGPVYVPETGELLFADTSAIGWLYALNAETYETRKVFTNPPLHNVNGGTYHNGKIYLTTNGGPGRGIFQLDITTGTAEVIVNNFRGRHFNSPNDLIFDSKSNILFTDPNYGWIQGLKGVQSPELPNAIYYFNTETKALTTMTSGLISMPNGLALSADESILYVADSSSISGKPVRQNPAGQRNVWAFDIKGSILSNPRLVHQAESGWPDGLRMSSAGHLMVAVAGGVDVVDPATGVLLGKINTPDDVIFNLEPAGKDGVWFLTGRDFIYKVTLDGQSTRLWSQFLNRTGSDLLASILGSFVTAQEKFQSYASWVF